MRNNDVREFIDRVTEVLEGKEKKAIRNVSHNLSTTQDQGSSIHTYNLLIKKQEDSSTSSWDFLKNDPFWQGIERAISMQQYYRGIGTSDTPAVKVPADLLFTQNPSSKPTYEGQEQDMSPYFQKEGIPEEAGKMSGDTTPLSVGSVGDVREGESVPIETKGQMPPEVLMQYNEDDPINVENNIVIPNESYTQEFRPEQVSLTVEELTEVRDTEQKEAETFTHYIGYGDTLEGIAKKYGTTSEILTKLNNLKSKNIRIGDTLQVPLSTLPENVAIPTPPVKRKACVGGDYEVKDGDGLFDVAKRSKVDIGKLIEWNGFDPRDLKLYKGESIYLCDPEYIEENRKCSDLVSKGMEYELNNKTEEEGLKIIYYDDDDKPVIVNFSRAKTKEDVQKLLNKHSRAFHGNLTVEEIMLVNNNNEFWEVGRDVSRDIKYKRNAGTTIRKYSSEADYNKGKNDYSYEVRRRWWQSFNKVMGGGNYDAANSQTGRAPDYYSFRASIGVPFIKKIPSFDLNITMDRHFQFYVSPLGGGLNAPTKRRWGVSFVAGQLAQERKPSPAEMSNFLKGLSFSAGGGYWAGGNVVYSKDYEGFNKWAMEFGLFTPQIGAGGDYTLGKPTQNDQDK